MEELNTSLNQYKDQLHTVNQALENVTEETERESLISLQSDLKQLIQLTQENLDSIAPISATPEVTKNASNEIDDEYALFMEEMAKSGAYEPNCKDDKTDLNKNNGDKDNTEDIEDELASLLGMKCAVYHTHKWGGQPTLHNAMVSTVVPREEDDQFKDLQVRVLFTHPTHTEMLPCPFFLDGECKFSDEQCRYSHGAIVPLSSLKEAIEPSFDTIKLGSRILMKLNPPDDEDICLTKKSTEKYHLWHRAIITSVDLDKRVCSVKLEHGVKAGEKLKASAEEYYVGIEDIFPLNTENDDDSSDGSLSDTEYPDNKLNRTETDSQSLIVERSLQNSGAAMGEWERHTRGIGSKLMLAMGYVPGSGLGATGEGRVMPVEARMFPVGKSLDQCMAISERNAKDPMKVEQRLQRLQKKEEERNKRAYDREKEREKRNVFNFINRTLGDDSEAPSAAPAIDVKQSTSKDLNIEQFKITEDVKKIERDVIKLNCSLGKYPSGTPGYRSIAVQIVEKNKELDSLRRRENQITREQKQRKDKAKMTVF